MVAEEGGGMNHGDVQPVVVRANMDFSDLKTLKVIAWHLDTYGYAVSLEELCLQRGWKSKDTAHRKLTRLRRLGFVDWLDDGNRTLHLTEHGKEVLG